MQEEQSCIPEEKSENSELGSDLKIQREEGLFSHGWGLRREDFIERLRAGHFLVEVDVRKTKDGAVLSHAGKVFIGSSESERPFVPFGEEIKTLKTDVASSIYELLSLEEALRIFQEFDSQYLFLDIKDPEVVDEIIKLIGTDESPFKDLKGRIAVGSQYPREVTEQLKDIIPGLAGYYGTILGEDRIFCEDSEMQEVIMSIRFNVLIYSALAVINEDLANLFLRNVVDKRRSLTKEKIVRVFSVLWGEEIFGDRRFQFIGDLLKKVFGKNTFDPMFQMAALKRAGVERIMTRDPISQIKKSK